MKARKNHRLCLTTLVIVALVVFYLLDRFIKQGFVFNPEIMADRLGFLPFSIYAFFNTGIIFGLSPSLGIIIFLSVVLLLAVVYFLLKAAAHGSYSQFFAWGLVLIGGFSNLWDRLLYGQVTDWWQMPWGAVINLADVYIFAGVIGLLFLSRKRV